MSFIQANKTNLKENDFGVHETLSYGLLNVRTQLEQSHPLEFSEKNHQKLEEERLMAQLRVNQGLYAPFKLNMEKQFALKVNRLPCLKSSNLMLSVLKGTDETLEIEDVINNQREFCEYNTDVHAYFDAKK